MAACKACGARNPETNGHHWGCGTSRKNDKGKK